MGRKHRRSILEKLRAHADAVRIGVSGGWLSLAGIVIDRHNERASFYNLSLWQKPFWRIIRPLSMIVGAQVTKHQRGASQPDYGMVIHLFHGDPIRFSCGSRAIAMAALDALHAQLPIETRSSGRYEPQDAAEDDDTVSPALWASRTARS